MPNPLTRKLASFVDLTNEDKAVLDHLCSDDRAFKAGEDLIQQGERPDNVFLLVEGWACRYKVLPDGRRQIMAYLLPGDLCDIHIFILRKMDHGISLLSEAKVAVIPERSMLEVFDQNARITRALFWSTLVDEGTLREWLVNIGQREAYERTAHLFCELWQRMSMIGQVKRGVFDLPLTQEQLADTMGLTTVHMNRVLQRLRAEGLIMLDRKRLAILDGERLRAISQFEPDYLHLDRRRE